MTFGFSRAEVLSAQANGLTLLILAAFIAYEAITRLVNPTHVDATLMLVVALVGMLANLAAVRLLAGAERRSLNIEGSLQHVLTDLYAAFGTAVAAVVILATDFERADPLASLLIAALMIRAGAALVWAGSRGRPGVGTPRRRVRLPPPRGVEVHDLCVEITSGFRRLGARGWWALLRRHEIRRELRAPPHEAF
jgi:cobalt-zinc-cadmium efflux system protein